MNSHFSLSLTIPVCSSPPRSACGHYKGDYVIYTFYFLLDLKAEDFALLFKFSSYVQLNLSIP